MKHKRSLQQPKEKENNNNQITAKNYEELKQQIWQQQVDLSVERVLLDQIAKYQVIVYLIYRYYDTT